MNTAPLLSRWFISHCRAIEIAYREWIAAPISNFLTVFIIGIALALPLGLFTILKNLQSVETLWDLSSPTISLYLKPDITDSQAQAIAQQFRTNKTISQVAYISPEQGLREFQKNTLFGDAVKLFQKNPIPGVIVVTPVMQDPQHIQTLYESLKASPLVDTTQLDIDWVTRLYDLIVIGKNVVNALSIVFGFGVILIIGHALRSSLSTQAKEIQVMRLVGATHAYIRRPLLYRGILYGFFGATVALILVIFFLSQLQTPVLQFAKTYHTVFQLQTISMQTGLTVLLLASVLGYLSAWLISMQFLNAPEQTE